MQLYVKEDIKPAHHYVKPEYHRECAESSVIHSKKHQFPRVDYKT